MKLGKMKEVDIRDLWKHEQYDFSNWLAKEENIEYLNDILPGLNFDHKDNYPQLMNDTIDRATLMRDVFKKYL